MENESVSQPIPRASGVYVLTHRLTRDQYVGSAGNLVARHRSHFAALRVGKYQNKRIAKLCGEHGIDFDFSVLQLTDPLQRWRRERAWIRKLKPSLNCGPASEQRIEREPKQAVNISLSLRNIEAIDRLRDAESVRPTLGQVVDAAVRFFLERYREGEFDTPAKVRPPRK
jgi:hypothetical protein